MSDDRDNLTHEWIEGRSAADEEAMREWEVQSSIDTLLRMQAGKLGLSSDFRERLSRRAATPRVAGREDHFVGRMGAARILRVAAALLLAAGLGWYLWPRAPRYPAVIVQRDYRTTSGQPLARGSVLVAERGDVALTLGGYCRLRLSAGGTLRLQGKEHAEEVFLLLGRLECDVDSGIGSFVVRTPVGVAHALGTRFVVHVIDEEVEAHETEAEPPAMRMTVKVDSGRVSLTGKGQESVLLHRGAARMIAAPSASQAVLARVRKRRGKKAFRAQHARARASELSDLAEADEIPVTASDLASLPGRPAALKLVRGRAMVATVGNSERLRRALRQAAKSYEEQAQAIGMGESLHWAKGRLEHANRVLSLEYCHGWLTTLSARLVSQDATAGAGKARAAVDNLIRLETGRAELMGQVAVQREGLVKGTSLAVRELKKARTRPRKGGGADRRKAGRKDSVAGQ